MEPFLKIPWATGEVKEPSCAFILRLRVLVYSLPGGVEGDPKKRLPQGNPVFPLYACEVSRRRRGRKRKP
jgi:hypothetical protein